MDTIVLLSSCDLFHKKLES